MPQVKRRHFRAFLAWLRALGIPYRLVAVPASCFAEPFGVDDVKARVIAARAASDPAWAKRKFGMPVIASSDRAIMDGRHRWLATVFLGGPHATVNACLVGVGSADLLRAASAFPLTERHDVEEIPEARRIAVLRHERRPFTAEVVAMPQDIVTGLSGRSTLPPDHGMLFLFPVLERHAFWMRGTSIPLSIAFMRDDGTVVGIYDMAPFTEDRHVAPEPVRIALEMPQGWFAARGIRVGSRVSVVDSGVQGGT